MNRNHLVFWLYLAMTAIAFSGEIAAGEGDSAAVAAQTSSATQTTVEHEEVVPSLTESVVPSLTRIAITLAVVVAIIYLTVFLLKKLSGNRMGGVGRGRTVQVIEQTYLAPKKSVCLLKLADRAVLVGITDNNITMLTEFDWDSLPEDIIMKTSRIPGGFQGVLSEAAGRLFGKKDKGVGRESTA